MRRGAFVFLCVSLLVLGGAPRAGAVVGGTDVKGRPFTFIVQMRAVNNETLCGGVIIAPQWALSAAHCAEFIQTRGGFTIVEGTNSTRATGVRHKVTKMFIHPGFKAAPDITTQTGYDEAGLVGSRYVQYNDVALFRIADTFAAPPIFVPGENDNALEKHGAKVTVAGWGATMPDGSNPSTTLKSVDLTIQADAKCFRVMTNEPKKAGESNVCAQGVLKDACNGDSGGPLFGRRNGRIALVGLVSAGYHCAIPAMAGTYAEVNAPAIRTFIRNLSGV